MYDDAKVSTALTAIPIAGAEFCWNGLQPVYVSTALTAIPIAGDEDAVRYLVDLEFQQP